MKGTRVFLTGANGFVGANTVYALLQEQADVHAFVRPNSDLVRLKEVLPEVTLHKGDLDSFEEVRNALRTAQPEVIFHLAAPAGHPTEPVKKIAMLVSALQGTANLLYAAQDIGCRRLIYSGSSTEYGKLDHAFIEDDLVDPITTRGVSKAGSTLLCRQFAQENQFPLTILRLFSVFGPWETPSRFIPKAILAAQTGQTLPLTQPGLMHDFVFVQDVVDALLKSVDASLEPGEIINIGGGRQWSNEEVVAHIEQISGKTIQKLPGAFPTRRVDSTFWQADISKAAACIGWKPVHTFIEGLQATHDWWLENLDFAGWNR
ncbi:MAG TPA: NAD(P)-dependent oxidoreductase [Longilinea sp.]|nr:NAD(P)-dependent oxidoreductase [Longilinea sp.]